MCQHCPIKTIHGLQHHYGWDNSFAPVLHAAPGERLEFDCRDSSNGHFTRDSVVGDVVSMPFDRINPVSGPVYVDGAQPGDALQVTIERFEPGGFGWTANIPGFGLLADQFTEPALALWNYDSASLAPAAFGQFAKVPLKPFAGTIGVAPAEPGLHSVVPPRRVGGNLDIRDLAAGTTLWLPVEVDGALFSIGDTHAAQGDGEVCGTAIESAMKVVVKLDLVKGAALAAPRFSTPGPVTRHLDGAGYEVATGIGPDLMQAARDAVSRTVDWLCATHHMPAEQAYMLCSVCGDLRISEIVDQPNWVVSFYFPKIVFA
ncbi:acetamidase/formamidase family protein [Paraburkholderia caballeronis]|uniref:Acetamidase/formamidase n=1 Tax=Paraburkholderia caballeronis TaxID=416943 RepID=A0A1H7RSQ9_9BURK|nr:acetamidase/formamidase family protein [Paraburkholderia caballeronis]PXW23195.1 acetamidase/formamidase [Paraburkholderia caballeronis]PXW97859.1 acetamidase/formamidase [Paraburkholderia caballeronis]RAJ94829.1 acetamidase/formamidase [Paraburkholderia caballeronis]SEE63193.1 Acetamidase/formamidase [Paraburkholderia caballeronis]SEL63330.1 Acetamidase/formamidase [Paraburkholderia caballeronis]